MKKKLLIFGSNAYAVRMFYCFIDHYDYEIAGFIVDKEYKTCDEIENIPLYDTEYVLNTFHPNEYAIFIAIGYTKLNTIREAKYNLFKDKGYSFVNFIHPSAIIERNVKLGDNLFIGAFVYISFNVTIGNNVVIEASSDIGHDSLIGDHCNIIMSRIAGYVTVKNNCFIGNNSAVKDKVTIGEYSVIGLGSQVNKNVNPYSVVHAALTKVHKNLAKLYLDDFSI